MRAIIKNINWRLPLFYIPAEQECISTHEVRARLGIRIRGAYKRTFRINCGSKEFSFLGSNTWLAGILKVDR